VPERLHVVPNWVDSKSVTPDDDRANEFRANRNIPHDAFVIVYGGNVGTAAGVETVIESFRYLTNDRKVYLIIAGAGSNLVACQQLAKKIDRQRIVFHIPWPVEETSMTLGAADVLVLPTRGRQSLVSVPSKLISYMLAARPVIALALPQSDLARIIERSGCGWIVEPDQPEQLAVKVEEVMAMEPAELTGLGQAGREFALRHLTREVCLPRVIDVLEVVQQEEGCI
jgi:colanic acid biosynthesis glycosyl transferase WcaI